jgi:hypothetical protein
MYTKKNMQMTEFLYSEHTHVTTTWGDTEYTVSQTFPTVLLIVSPQR